MTSAPARPSGGWWGRGLAIALAGVLIAFFVLPAVALVLSVPFGVIVSAANDRAIQASIAFTLYASGIAVALSALFGVPLGYLLARHRFPGRSLVQSVVAVPVAIPHLIAGLGIAALLAPRAPLGALAISLGAPIYETIWGVIAVMVYVSAPYTVLASELAFRSVSTETLEAARCLGAGPAETFASVTLPAAARGIGGGALLTWARAVSEIGGFLIVAYAVYPSPPYSGPVTSPISVYIYNLYQINEQSALAVASVFIGIALLIFLIARIAAGRGAPIVIPGMAEP